MGGAFIRGGVYFENFEKGGGVYSRGAFNRSNTVEEILINYNISSILTLINERKIGNCLNSTCTNLEGKELHNFGKLRAYT